MTTFRTSLIAAAIALACTTSSSIVLAQTDAPVDAHPVAAPPATPTPQGENQAPSEVPPAQVTPPPAATAAPSAVVDYNQAARDPRTLNPLLIPTDSEIGASIEQGRTVGKSKQDFIDLLNPSRRAFQYHNGGMFGERRRPTGVAVWVTPDTEARWRGFIEARAFADSGQRDADFQAVRDEVTSPQRNLTFIVEIGDVLPGHPSDPPQAALDAAYASLSGTKFVLSDDHDNNYNPENVAMAPHLLRRQEFYDALSSGPDRMVGTAAFAPAADNSHQLVLRRKQYDDYAAFYIVTFPAFNPDGAARVNRDVHTLTLRIVTPDEPKFAVFDVAKMP